MDGPMTYDIDQASADGAQESPPTFIRPWSPGQRVPDDLIRLGPTPRDTLNVVEDRARVLVRRIVGEYATARRWSHDPEGWAKIARLAIWRQRKELRGVLEARRALRTLVERDEDRVSAQVNGNG